MLLLTIWFNQLVLKLHIASHLSLSGWLWTIRLSSPASSVACWFNAAIIEAFLSAISSLFEYLCWQPTKRPILEQPTSLSRPFRREGPVLSYLPKSPPFSLRPAPALHISNHNAHSNLSRWRRRRRRLIIVITVHSPVLLSLPFHPNPNSSFL